MAAESGDPVSGILTGRMYDLVCMTGNFGLILRQESEARCFQLALP